MCLPYMTAAQISATLKTKGTDARQESLEQPPSSRYEQIIEAADAQRALKVDPTGLIEAGGGLLALLMTS